MNNKNKKNSVGSIIAVIVAVIIIVVVGVSCSGACSSHSGTSDKWNSMTKQEQDNARWAYDVQQYIKNNK